MNDNPSAIHLRLPQEVLKTNISSVGKDDVSKPKTGYIEKNTTAEGKVVSGPPSI